MSEQFKLGILKQRGCERGVVGGDQMVLYLGLHADQQFEPQALTPWTVDEARELRDWLNDVLPTAANRGAVVERYAHQRLEMVKSPDGNWVRVSDYDALAANSVAHAWRAEAAEARIRELEAALTRAADTFADLAKVSSMLGRTRMSEACCVAEGDARNVLAGSPPSAKGEQPS